MSFVDVSTLGRTKLIGGSDAPEFIDTNKLISNGQLNLHGQFPIKQIKIRAGWVVDGLEITYRRADGSTVTIGHGTLGDSPNPIDLLDTEVVAAVFGRAGYQNYYKENLINCIGFTIFNRERCTTRIVGPFGNGNGSDNGEPFATGGAFAFGGYAQEDLPQRGLRGLYVIQQAGGTQGLYPIPLPDAFRSGLVYSDVDANAKEIQKTVNIEPAHVPTQLPSIVHGFYLLDLLSVPNGPGIRVKASIKNATERSFDAVVKTWQSSHMYAAGINWVDLPLGRGIQGGIIPHQEATLGANAVPYLKEEIRFDRPYDKPPTVLLWLAGMDLGPESIYRIQATATNITKSGFTANAQTWLGSSINGAGLAWLAIPADAQDVMIGTKSVNMATRGSVQISFGRKLSRVPKVICGFSKLDFLNTYNLRCKTSAEDITDEGFKLNINTWADSVMYEAQVSWIAIA